MTTATAEDPPRCNQLGCNEPGAYRYTWPGKEEALVCERCVVKLRRTAAAISLPIQIIPLPKESP